MPEGPEIRVIADSITKNIGTIFEGASILENVPGLKHRYSREAPKNWEAIALNRWKLINIRTKGKLILMDVETVGTKQPWTILSTMGMSGDWRHNSAGNKHARIAFLKANGEDLTLVDIRCFASLRIVTPEEAKKLESKVGHDLLKAPMEKERWKQLQFNSKIKDEEIKIALLTQNLFAGLGNIYVAESLYETGIDPRRIVAKLDPAKWEQINITAHNILQKAYKLGGSSVKDFTADGKNGSAQTTLKVYGRKVCPKGFKVQTIQQDGRTTWFVEEVQVY